MFLYKQADSIVQADAAAFDMSSRNPLNPQSIPCTLRWFP